MLTNFKNKLSNFIHKKRNKKLHEIEDYLKSLNMNVELFKKEKVIEFNKKKINQNVYLSSHFKYNFDGETLTFYPNLFDNYGWLQSLIDSDIASLKIKKAFDKVLNEHFSYSKNRLLNGCIKLQIERFSNFIVKVTKESITVCVDFSAKQIDESLFFVEIMLSINDDKVTINYAPNEGDIVNSVDCSSDPIIDMNHELTHQYVLHFLTDYAKFELLGISETNPYNSETHGEILKMFYI